MREQLNNHLVEALIRRIELLAEGLEKASIAEYVEFLRNPTRMFLVHFGVGVFRGFGIAVGFSVVGAAFFLALARLASLNLPVIGEYIADIARIVQLKLKVP